MRKFTAQIKDRILPELRHNPMGNAFPNDTKPAFDLHDLMPIFNILFTGWTLAAVAFVGENLNYFSLNSNTRI